MYTDEVDIRCGPCDDAESYAPADLVLHRYDADGQRYIYVDYLCSPCARDGVLDDIPVDGVSTTKLVPILRLLTPHDVG